MKLDIFDINGKSTGKSVDLPDDKFKIEPNKHTVYLAVKSYLASQRQGTHKAKERGEIKGSTKKIKKQKGTGTARAGSIKNPLFKGGGRIFGPRPRTYSVKLNKKVKRLAKQSAIVMKINKGAFRVLEDFTFDKPQTKQFKSIVSSFNAESEKSLFVLNEYDKNLFLSSRNLPKSKVININELSTYDIMNASQVFVSENAIESLKKTIA